MSMDISAVREGLKVRLETIDGLRGHAYVPDQIIPPAAVVDFPIEYTFTGAFQRGLDEITIPILVCVNRMDDRSGQAAIDEYVSGTGPRSIKAALEADQSLSGSASAVFVRNVQNFGWNNEMYFAEFIVEIKG